MKESVSLSLDRSCLHFLGGLGTGSVAVLLLSLNVLDVSASTSAGSRPSDGLDGPGVSSLLGVETTAGGGVLSLLEVEVGLSRVSGDGVRMAVLLTVGWSTSSLHGKEKIRVRKRLEQSCLVCKVYLPFFYLG